MKVHACFLDEECRSIVGGHRIWRVYLHSRRLGHVTIALRPRDRVQGWLPILGALPPHWPGWLTWWFVVYHPSNSRPGWLVRRHPEWYGIKKGATGGWTFE